MNIRDFIKKLQNLPEKQRKIILWTIVIILALGLGSVWIKMTIDKFSKMEPIKINLDVLKAPEFQNTQDQTADWQTYTNSEYGFEIKYPAGSSIREDSYSNPVPGWGFIIQDSSLEFALNVIKISDLNISANRTTQETTVDGVKGKIVKLITASPDECYSIYVEKGARAYIFGTGCKIDGDLFNQILSTFKFTK